MGEKNIYSKVIAGIIKANQGKTVLIEYKGLQLTIIKGKYYPFTDELSINDDPSTKKDIPVS